MTWADKLEARGEVRGERRAMHRLLCRQLTKRFGPLPDRVVKQLEAIDSTDELSALADRVLDASSLEDMGLEP